MGDLGSIPGLGRSPGKGEGYQLQYSGLKNSMDCIDYGVAKSQTRLSNFTSLHFTVYRLLTHYLSKERIQSFLSHLLIILFSSLLKNLEGGWASLMAQRVKHSPAMWETWVRSLGQENPLEKEMATHSSTFAWKIHMDREAW